MDGGAGGRGRHGYGQQGHWQGPGACAWYVLGCAIAGRAGGRGHCDPASAAARPRNLPGRPHSSACLTHATAAGGHGRHGRRYRRNNTPPTERRRRTLLPPPSRPPPRPHLRRIPVLPHAYGPGVVDGVLRHRQRGAARADEADVVGLGRLVQRNVLACRREQGTGRYGLVETFVGGWARRCWEGGRSRGSLNPARLA